MSREDTFDLLVNAHPVIGRRAPADAAALLRAIGDNETARALESRTSASGTKSLLATRGPGEGWFSGLFAPKPWQHTAHTFGFLPHGTPGAAAIPLISAHQMAADTTLKGGRITISLDRLRVAEYPGRGVHRVLFEFYARNTVAGNQEEYLHYNATCRAREGQEAAVIGLPLFVGLCVGHSGVDFRCYTINVENEGSRAVLDTLESDTFKAGLKLATTLQPALAPYSGIAVGLTKAIAGSTKNIPVQEFRLGLDFDGAHMGVRLAEGSYIAVQIPEEEMGRWDWSEWCWHPTRGQLAHRDDPAQLIPYNYVVFRVSRYAGE